MKTIDLSYKIAGLDLPHINSDDKLGRILTAALPNKSDKTAQQQSDYWDAEFFNLHQVKIFQQASLDEQSAILQLTNCSLLAESYFIEKAGVGYMAKMVLLAETVEERMLYAIFSADEATHLSQIINFLPVIASTSSNDPFLNLLAEVVESADKTVLLFVLQVVLEGWGLSHYRRLSKECHHPILRELFSSFIQAESRHHGTGTMLFKRNPVSATSKAAAIEVLASFLSMVQVGPQSVLSAIEQVKGHLSRSQKIQILEELDTQTHSGTRLEILRSLMRGASAEAIVQALDERDAFQPLPPDKCVY
ncbi:ferritin-like domain-containing protein [Nostoc linckia FACHB-104]|nr:ferritin-like domain-containing protein [Nostoc linckia FACHB-104]